MKTVDELAKEYWTKRHVEDPNAEHTEDAFKAGYAARDEEVQALRKQVLDMQKRYAGATKYISELEKCLEIAEKALNEIKTAFPRDDGHETAMLSNYFRLRASHRAANSALAQIKAIKDGTTKEVLPSTKISSCEGEK